MPSPSIRTRRMAALALLVILVPLGDRLVGAGLGHLTLQSQLRYSRLYAGGQKNEIVALGASRCVNAFYVPAMEETLGVSAMNLAHNHLSMELLEALWRDYLDRNQTPRLVLIELTSVGFKTSGPIQGFRPYLHYSRRLEDLSRTYDDYNYRVSRVFRLFTFNNEMFMRSIYHLHKSDQDWVRHEVIPRGLLDQVARTDSFRLDPPIEENLEALTRIVASAREAGVVPRLVVTPYLPAYRKKLTNFDENLEAVRERVGKDVRIWDFSLAVDETRYFADRWHLNESGARVFIQRSRDAGLYNPSL